MGQTFKWILRQGGLSEMLTKNADKSQLLYQAIDGSDGFYRNSINTNSRFGLIVVVKVIAIY